MRRTDVFKLFVLSGAVLLPSAALAQAVSATILGTTADSSGAVVPAVHITARETGSGFSRSAETNGAGEFQFPALPPGTYTVTATKDGFDQTVRENVLLVVNTTLRLNLSLSPGKTSEVVNVTAETPMLQTDRADVTMNFDSHQAEDLPLYGNDNPQTLLNLVPGTTRAVQLNTAFFNAQSALSTYVNGQSKLANNLLIEGIDDNERTGELQVYIPPAQALQTVDVTTSNYAPEFGRAAGSVTNFVFKSGSDAFHGEVFEQNRVAALTARNSFNTPATGPVTPYVYNYYGANLGGPIHHKRTYFFGDFLRIDDHEGLFGTYTLPTMAFRSGDLRAGGTNIYDPNTGTSAGKGRTQLAYNGTANVIDPARISQVAKNLLALLPALPTNAPVTNNYTAITSFAKDYTSWDGKIDQNLFANDRFSLRYSGQNIATYYQPTFGTAGGPANGGAVGNGTQKTYNIGANYTHPLMSNLLTEVRIGVDHYRNTVTLPKGGETLATQVGIPGVNVGSNTNGLTSINITGFSSPLLGFNKNYPFTRGETNVVVANLWTWIHGSHTFKAGGEFHRVRDDLGPSATFPQRGIFNFGPGQTALNGAPTGVANNFASFLLDVPQQAGQTVVSHEGTYRQSQIYGFLQDTWQATPKLTATGGVRWEYYQPPSPSYAGGMANYDPTANNLLIAGYGSVPMDLGVARRYANFAPRLGLVYRFTEKTILRAGYGISHYPLLGDGYGYNNYPITVDGTYNSLTSYTPAVNGTTPVHMNTGFPQLALPALPSTGILSAPKASTYVVVNTQQPTPYVESWNLFVEQAMPLKLVMNLGYVGNIGINAPEYFNLNAATSPNTGAAGQPQYAAFGRTAASNLLGKGFTTHYNSLQARLTRRFSNGLGFTASYTFGKALAYATDTTAMATIAYYTDLHKNYGRMSYDRSSVATQSFLYDLPFGRGHSLLNSRAGNLLAGGWRVAGVLTEMSGLPLTFTASATTLNAPGNGQLASQIAPFHVLHGTGSSRYWFDPSSFSTPAAVAPGQTGSGLGNTGVGTYSGPAFFNFDASVQREFSLHENIRLQLKADAFGATNTPQYANPDTSLADGAAFGTVTSSTGSRVLQLSGKVSF